MRDPAEHPDFAKPAARFGRWLAREWSTQLNRVEVLSPYPLGPTEGAIIACNHTSGLDPVLLQAACPRLIVWMMAKEYYDLVGLNAFLRQIEAIPVARSGKDLAATRAALRALKNGRVLGIFPEGRIEEDRNLLPFETGVALLATKANVPVVPAYIDGTQRGQEMLDALLSVNNATLRFGQPLRFDPEKTDRDGLEAATAQLRDAIELLAAEG